ncbi:MAG: hypothetical protein IPJ41_07640 [Phycisphaerales bacterium]|nr:hypothetical protein [Phycisphaerales bacterium]
MTSAAALKALESRGKGRLLGHPEITTRCGERASVALVSPEPAGGEDDPWAHLRAGSVRGFALSVDPSLEPDSRLGLEMDFLYRPKTKAEDTRHDETIARCQQRLTLPDGACAVLGGQRLVDEPAPGAPRPLSTLLLVVQATTVD